MTAHFHVIIPARYHSIRFPGKLLQDIRGQSVLQRVYGQALQSGASSIIIATDHEEIAAHAKSFGAEVCMTASTHATGTDRLAEVVQQKQFLSDALIVNVQGDEPFIPPAVIRQVAQSLEKNPVPMATLCIPIDSLAQFQDPNVVKVVFSKTNKALYFSRSPIPAQRDNPESFRHSFKHIGIYAYRASFLLEYVNLPGCELESCELLEQLRVLWAGHAIQVDVACEKPLQDINTPSDLLAIINTIE